MLRACLYVSIIIEALHTCRHGGTYKVLKNLLKHKLLHHDSSKCEFTALNYTVYVLDGREHVILLLFCKYLICYPFHVHLDDGFRLTYLGYDFLAIKTMVNRGVFAAVGRQIGVGKESGIILKLAIAKPFALLKC